jgi:xanthine dehydrogenase accessory factor
MMPDDAVKTYAMDKRCAVVTLSHTPNIDDMALMEALESPAFYVGALGSLATSEKRRQRLASLGLELEAIQRLHAPMGFAIGSHTPAEIAISLLAELTAVKNGIFSSRSEPAASAMACD